MDYKEIMDIWYVWTIGGIIIYKYVKGVIDNWDDWIDEDGKWFKYWNKPNPKQMELFDEK